MSFPVSTGSHHRNAQGLCHEGMLSSSLPLTRSAKLGVKAVVTTAVAVDGSRCRPSKIVRLEMILGGVDACVSVTEL